MTRSLINMEGLFNIENILNSVFSQKQFASNYPVMDVYSLQKDDKTQIVYEIAVPGINPDEISVEADDNQGLIRISQEREKENDESNETKTYHVRNIGRRKFRLVLMLPPTHFIENENVVIKNGILQITLNEKDKPDNSVRKLQPIVVGREI